MQTAGLILILTLGTPPAPAWVRGEQHHYVGEATEYSKRPGQLFRKQFGLEIRVLVLGVSSRQTDLAVMTSVTPRDDSTIAAAAATISGSTVKTPEKGAAIRVDYVRLTPDKAGHIEFPKAVPGIDLQAGIALKALPSMPLNGPSYSELDFLTALIAPESGDSNPWTRRGQELWNGSRVTDLVRSRQSRDFDTPSANPSGWRRTDRLFVSMLDGLPRAYARTIEHREGKTIVAGTDVRWEARPALAPGESAALRTLRNEADLAAWSTAMLDRCETLDRRAAATLAAGVAVRIDRALAETATVFRPALEVARKRCTAWDGD